MDIKSCLEKIPAMEFQAMLSYRQSVDSRITRLNNEQDAPIHPDDPVSIKMMLDNVQASDREMLLRISMCGTPICKNRVILTWGFDDPDLTLNWIHHRRVEAGIPILRLSGLLFKITSESDAKDGYVVPAEVKRVLMDYFRPSENCFPPLSPYQYLKESTDIISDIFDMVSYFAKNPVRLTIEGIPSQKTLMKIQARMRASLNEMDDSLRRTYFAFLFELAQKRSLIVVRGRNIAVDREFFLWTHQESVQKLQELSQLWMMNDHYDEFHNIPDQRIGLAGLRYPNQIVRQLILIPFQFIPANKWISIFDIDRYLNSQLPHFFRPEQNDENWKIKDIRTDRERDMEIGWETIESRLLRFFITGPLSWLNMVRVGLDAHGIPESVMVTHLGHSLLTNRSPDPANLQIDHDHDDKILVQPDFELFLSENAPLSIKYSVEAIADRVSSGPVLRYRLTRSSISHALMNGFPGKEILRFLTDTSSPVLPQNVTISIQSWIEQFGRIGLYSVFILRTKDRFLMEELNANPDLCHFFKEMMGSRSARVSPKNVSILCDALKKADYLPCISPSLMMSQEIAPVTVRLTKEKAEFLLSFLTGILGKLDIDMEMQRNIKDISVQIEQAIREYNYED